MSSSILWKVKCDECGEIGEPTTNYAALRKALKHAESGSIMELPEGQFPIVHIVQLEKLT